MSRTMTFTPGKWQPTPTTIKYEYPLGSQTGEHRVENYLGESRVDTNRDANIASASPVANLATRETTYGAPEPSAYRSNSGYGAISSPRPTVRPQTPTMTNSPSTNTTLPTSEYEKYLTSLRTMYGNPYQFDYKYNTFGTGGGGNVGGGFEDTFGNYLDTFNQQTDKYINDLMADAQGDLDFALKQLNRQHEIALGQDDKARAEFIESVADKLEEKIGRIPYDYEKYTTRTKEDTAKVLSRLAEDETIWKADMATQSGEARQAQSEDLSARGLLQGTRQGATGIAKQETGKLEQDIEKQVGAYDRALARSASDTQQESVRTLDDLKTQARRGAIDAEDQYVFGKESSERSFNKIKKELERQREASKLTNKSKAMIESGYAYGY